MTGVQVLERRRVFSDSPAKHIIHRWNEAGQESHRASHPRQPSASVHTHARAHRNAVRWRNGSPSLFSAPEQSPPAHGMPHTNRARRADHYRSIDGSNSRNAKSHNINGGAAHHRAIGGAGSQKDAFSDTNTDDRYNGSGRGGGRGEAGRGAGSESPAATSGRGAAGEDGRARRGRGGGEGTPSKGGKKAPSAKNRIRSLTRLMNKPVREPSPACCFAVFFIGWLDGYNRREGIDGSLKQVVFIVPTTPLPATSSTICRSRFTAGGIEGSFVFLFQYDIWWRHLSGRRLFQAGSSTSSVSMC